jgi:hypothetical protein
MQINPEQLTSPYLRAVHAFWLQAKGDRPAPQRADIDPLAMPPKVLPYLMLIEFERAPFRVRYRLAGTNVVELNGGEFTGKYLDEMRFPPGVSEMLHGHYQRVAETCLPVFGSYDWALRAGGMVPIEFALMPLLVGDIVTHCLAAEHTAPNLPISIDDIVDV